MKTGNKTQAAVLSIVAVGAIGFLAMQLVPAGKHGSGAAGTRQATPSSDFHLAVLSSDLVRDPFAGPSHAKAEPKKEQHAEPAPKPKAAKQKSKRAPGPVAPFVPDGITPLPGSLPGIASAEEPEGSAGENRLEITVRKVKVHLDATLRVEHELAVLSIDGKEAQQYRAGDVVAEGIRVVSIGDGQVTLHSKNGNRTLGLGEDVEL